MHAKEGDQSCPRAARRSRRAGVSSCPRTAPRNLAHDRDASRRAAPSASPATGDVPAENPRALAERLRGRPLPQLALPPSRRPLVEQIGFGGCVIYAYHGLSEEIDGDSAKADASQHRAFQDSSEEWEQRDVSVIGLSSQSEAARTLSILVGRLEHELVSDRDLLLADALGLPTFTCEGQRCYERLMLIVLPTGRIAHVFFPLDAPGRAAIQALTWMKLYGPVDPRTPWKRV